MLARLKKEGLDFLEAIRKGNDTFFFLLLCLFITSNVVVLINWRRDLFSYAWKAHFLMFAAVMWGSAIYLFSIILEWRDAWKRTGEIIAIGAAVFIVTGIVSKTVTTDSYAFVMGAYFCLMACGKKYKKIFYCFLFIIVAALLIGWIGLRIHITLDAVKPRRAYGGHSLGILYPNDWGYFVFNVMLIIWYMFLRQKKIITLVFFWGISVFMYKYITCLTIAGMAFLFPVVGIIAELIQSKLQEREKKHFKAMKTIVIALPFIFLGLMLLGCWRMDWIHTTFYDTPLESMAMRFVEGGYSLMNNGVTLFGQPFRQWNQSLVDYSQEIEMIVDSALICYLIIRGIIPMIMTLGWLSFAHNRCLRKKDYRLLAISTFMLLFSMMERPGLDAWYNFVLLYPLASLNDQENSIPVISEATQ